VGVEKFVGYRIDLFVLLAALDHGVDETRPVRTKHPRHRTTRCPCQLQAAVLSPAKLRFAVRADRIRLILFCVRRAFLPSKNVIGTESESAFASFRFADFRQESQSLRINQKRAIALSLASIDVRERCRVNQHIESCGAHFLAQILQIRKIKLRVIEDRDIVSRSEFRTSAAPSRPPAPRTTIFIWSER
jgi:hypothetical protein